MPGGKVVKTTIRYAVFYNKAISLDNLTAVCIGSIDLLFKLEIQLYPSFKLSFL